MPQDDRTWVVQAATSVPGVLACHHLLDEATGDGLSVMFYTDDTDLTEVEAAISRAALDIGRHDTDLPAPRYQTLPGRRVMLNPPVPSYPRPSAHRRRLPAGAR